MTISSISRYRGGTVDDVMPLARSLKAIYLRYGVGYWLGRVEGDPNAGDWMVTGTYADADAYAKATTQFADDPELQAAFHAIALCQANEPRCRGRTCGLMQLDCQ